jgi:hypothetical protein
MTRGSEQGALVCACRLGLAMENMYGDVVNMLIVDLARKFGISENRFEMTNPRSGRCATRVRCRGDCQRRSTAAVRGRVPSEPARLFRRVGCGLRFRVWVAFERSILR